MTVAVGGLWWYGTNGVGPPADLDQARGTFSGPLRIERRPDAFRWLVFDAFTYVSLAGWAVTVMAGFVTDGASVPRPLWWLWPPLGGQYDRSAVVHDYLYKHAEDFAGLTRWQVDRLMLEMMQVDGVGWWARRAIYAGVVAGGWVTWNRYRSETTYVSVPDEVIPSSAFAAGDRAPALS